jgi:hypothetical protein
MKHYVLMRKAAMHGRSLALGACVLTATALAFVTTPVQAQVSIGVTITAGSPPPPLPVYDQPPIPDDGYMWVPGYWAWDGAEYYWVPGTWVTAPYTGALWTPAYWAWNDGVYVFHEGYWGPEVGYYGGIDYGYGYTGRGYEGGRWGPHGFYYNRAVNNIRNVHVTNVYNQTVVNNITVKRVSYNGGNGGVRAAPTAQQVAYQRAQHSPPVAAQRQQMTMARQNRALRASENHGAPPIAATARPAAFTGAGIVAAHGARAAEAGASHLTPGARPVPDAHPQPAQRPGLPSEHFAPHSRQNPNAEPLHAPVTPSRPFERPENVGAPHMQPHPEAAPAPRAAPHEAPAPREVPHQVPPPREMAPERLRPEPQPAYHPAPPPAPAYHPAPRPEQAPHPAAPPRQAPPPHENKHEEQHPPGG